MFPLLYSLVMDIGGRNNNINSNTNNNFSLNSNPTLNHLNINNLSSVPNHFFYVTNPPQSFVPLNPSQGPYFPNPHPSPSSTNFDSLLHSNPSSSSSVSSSVPFFLPTPSSPSWSPYTSSPSCPTPTTSSSNFFQTSQTTANYYKSQSQPSYSHDFGFLSPSQYQQQQYLQQQQQQYHSPGDLPLPSISKLTLPPLPSFPPPLPSSASSSSPYDNHPLASVPSSHITFPQFRASPSPPGSVSSLLSFPTPSNRELHLASPPSSSAFVSSSSSSFTFPSSVKHESSFSVSLSSTSGSPATSTTTQTTKSTTTSSSTTSSTSTLKEEEVKLNKATRTLLAARGYPFPPKANQKKHALNDDEEKEFKEKRGKRGQPIPKEWAEDKKSRYRKWLKHRHYLVKKQEGITTSREYLEKQNARSRSRYQQQRTDPVLYQKLRAQQRIYERNSKQRMACVKALGTLKFAPGSDGEEETEEKNQRTTTSSSTSSTTSSSPSSSSP